MASTTAQTAAEHAFGTNAAATAAGATATAPIATDDQNKVVEEQMGPALPPGWTKPVVPEAERAAIPIVSEAVITEEHSAPVISPDWTKPATVPLETATTTDTSLMPPSPPSTAPEQVLAKEAPILPPRISPPKDDDDPFVSTPTVDKESSATADHSQNTGIWAASLCNDIPYVRSPSRLIAYLIPYAEPQLPNGAGSDAPQRFFIYTPPLPPLNAPNDGLPKGGIVATDTTLTKKEKLKSSKKRAATWWKGDGKGNEETKSHRVQRWWQGNVREAKENPAPVKTFKGVRGRAEIGIQKAMNWTKSSNVEFLLRVPSNKPDKDATPRHWGLEEIVLVYPPEMRGTPEEIRAEFLRTLLATKSKAYVESVVATGLFPVGLVIDTLCALFWPFGGLAEIAAVWAIASVRSARTARSLLKRIDHTGLNPDAKLKLTFVPSAQAAPLQQYLDAECHVQDMIHFNKTSTIKPGEAAILNAVGWQPSTVNGKAKNFQDEQWEARVAKEDLEMVVKKGTKEYRKSVKKFAKKAGRKSRGKQNVRFWKKKEPKVVEKN